MTTALTNTSFIVDEDSSSAFYSPVSNLESAISALNYEISWEAGVTGVFTFEGAITEEKFQPSIGCDPVSFSADGSAGFEIVSIFGVWLTLGFIRFGWVPSSSTGNINVVLRVVPS